MYQSKSSVHLAIGLQPNLISRTPRHKASTLQFLYVGNLLYLKGIHIAFSAFSNFIKEYPDAHLTLIGSGPDELWLREHATKLGLDSHLTWVPYMPRQELINQYECFDALLFPSLHDSGGIVVLEALAKGLPVICLDIGGPGRIVTQDCGWIIPTANRDENQVIHHIQSTLQDIVGYSEEQWANYSQNALYRAQNFEWSTVVSEISHSY
jgi:glycosyltransferase involved in cell wall biosynthesis